MFCQMIANSNLPSYQREFAHDSLNISLGPYNESSSESVYETMIFVADQGNRTLEFDFMSKTLQIKKILENHSV